MIRAKADDMVGSPGFSLYVFDMGNVVVRGISTLEAISDHYGIPCDELREDYNHYEFPLMEGTIDSTLYWHHVEHVFGIRVHGDPLAEFFHPRWNEPVARLVGRLRAAGKRVVCGSNTYAPHWEWAREQGFLAIFDGLYASHEMGITKPSPRFFRHILDTERVAAKDAFFVDDFEENVIAARKVGMTALHYVDGTDGTADDRLSRYFSRILSPSS